MSSLFQFYFHMERHFLIISIALCLTMCVIGTAMQHPVTFTTLQAAPRPARRTITLAQPILTKVSAADPIRVQKQDMYAARLHSLPKAHCLYQTNALEHSPYTDRLQTTAALPGVRVSAAEQPEGVAFPRPEILTNNVNAIVSHIQSGVGQAAFDKQNEFPASVPYLYPDTVLYQVKQTKPQSPEKPMSYRKADNDQTYVPLPVTQRCGTGQPVPENYKETPASVQYNSPQITAYNIEPTTSSTDIIQHKNATWTGKQKYLQNYHVNPDLASSGTGYGQPANEGSNEFPADVSFRTDRVNTFRVDPDLASQGTLGLAHPANEQQNEFPARVHFKTKLPKSTIKSPLASQRLRGPVSPAHEHRNEYPAALDS